MSAAGRTRPAGSRRTGRVSLVGAGPGAPDLLTARAIARLGAADVVFYDGLTSRRALALAPRARHVSVARRVGRKTRTLDDVVAMMIDAASQGQRVVRLKSGDPMLLGRGGEEARALSEAGVRVEIVPGVSTALAAPALAGIPVTHRGLSAALVVVSGHGPDGYGPIVDRLAPGSATVVVLMGLGERAALARRLRRAGWTAATPAAVILNASRTGQRVWSGTLGALGRRDGIVGRQQPGVIVIGEVVDARTATEVFRA